MSGFFIIPVVYIGAFVVIKGVKKIKKETRLHKIKRIQQQLESEDLTKTERIRLVNHLRYLESRVPRESLIRSRTVAPL